MSSTYECDGASVGVLIRDDGGQVLVGTRSDGAGIAPIAGHVFDAHTSYEDAAVAEAAEEAGMTVVPGSLEFTVGGYRANRCAHGDGPNGPGHVWRIYTARATGTPHSADGEMLDLHWATRGELAVLIARTAARAHGRVTDAEWRAEPGLEPVWCRWLVLADVTSAPLKDLAAIDAYIAT